MATDTTASTPMRLALVGLGGQAREHLHAQHGAPVRIVAGVDHDAHQRKQFQLETEGLLPVYSSVDALSYAVQLGELDGLVLCLPHHVYSEQWDQIVGLGLPILKEKPLARSLAEARDFTQRAASKGIFLKTTKQRRHHPSYRWLVEQIRARRAVIHEASAWMYMGRNRSDAAAATWRDDRSLSGGGALLDAGYHMVDLMHLYVGSFDLVQTCLWRNGARCPATAVEDEAWVYGCNELTWLSIDIRIGGPAKSEGFVLQTNQGHFEVNRHTVLHDGRVVFEGEKSWQAAMTDQLRQFVQEARINSPIVEDEWEQFPAMQTIDRAYQLATQD